MRSRAAGRAAVTVVGAAMVVGVWGGCQWGGSTANSAGQSLPGRSLFERVGGQDTLRRVADDTVERSLRDPRVNLSREGPAAEGAQARWEPTTENIQRFKEQLGAFLMQVSGGPRAYRGRDMRESHRGMGITEAEFQAFRENLRAAMSSAGVPGPESREMLRLIDDYRGDIVESGPLGRPLPDRGRERIPM
ncbi:MAG: group 1 truncated hemoglobin [Phycisphaerales bacterium]